MGIIMSEQMILKTNGLYKRYGSKNILQDVSITVNKGDIYGLVGKNGAGKTTLMRILTGLQVPTEGTVEYGFDRKRLGSVGALVELPSIYSDKTARENIVFQYINLGLKPDNSIDDLLKLVGLHNTGNKKVGKFSLGMRQRMGIAMAMVGDPEVLILDEPINGLDPEGIIGVRDLLLSLNRDKGITIIISSHILSELAKLATRFAFIGDGKILRENTAYDIEHSGEKFLLVNSDRNEDLKVLLNSKGFNAETDSAPGMVTVHSDSSVTDIVLLAHEEGIVITEIKTTETDLEDYYIGIVGGGRNA